MFQTLSCVCISLGMRVEVKVHSYRAGTHVCVGSCICFVLAMALSKLQ